nr:MAG TPA: hypothetical protein [Caudoviricetes sp.]
MCLNITMCLGINRGVSLNFINSIIFRILCSKSFILTIFIIGHTKVRKNFIGIRHYLRLNHIIHQSGAKAITVDYNNLSLIIII